MKLPKGFKYAGINCGLKKKQKDLGLIVSEKEAVAAGVTTQSQTAAAPVLISRDILKKGKGRSVIINTICANAATGDEGLRNGHSMSVLTSELYGGPTIIASTGCIGKQLPMDIINKGIKSLGKAAGNDEKSFNDLAEAILTTDLVVKKVSRSFRIADKEVVICGVAKGSGMIHPDMATMLGFITTDARIEHKLLQKTLKELNEISFNSITVDGDTSTNDMVVVLANGMSGVEINKGNLAVFVEVLKEVMIYLAKEIARDGEGATKLIEVKVSGAKSEKEARLVAKTVAGSPLVKCAIYGEDENWGRVVAAVGRAGVKIDPDKVKTKWSDLKSKEVVIDIDLGLGNKTGKAWGCDLTEGYIKINTKYN